MYYITYQNKRKSLLIFLFFFQYALLIAQTSFIGYENLKNRAEIQNGNEKINQELLEKIKYPVSLQYFPEVTVLIACLEISPKGEIIRIFSLNSNDNLFLLEFDHIISSLKVEWVSPNSDTCYYVQAIEFRTVPLTLYETDYYFMPEYIHDPIVCLSKYTTDNIIIEDKKHIENYENYLKQKKYSKALKELDILISRNPFKEIFYVKKVRLYTYMGNIGDAIREEKKIEILFR